jgi:bacteriorhodopsin
MSLDMAAEAWFLNQPCFVVVISWYSQNAQTEAFHVVAREPFLREVYK